MCTSAPKAPTLPPPPPPPQEADTTTVRSADTKKKNLAAASQSGTIVTGAQGLTNPASTTARTLLG